MKAEILNIQRRYKKTKWILGYIESLKQSALAHQKLAIIRVGTKDHEVFNFYKYCFRSTMLDLRMG